MARSFYKSAAVILFLASTAAAGTDVTDVALGASVSSKNGVASGNLEMTYFYPWRQQPSKLHTTATSFEVGIAKRDKGDVSYVDRPSTSTLASSVPTDKTVSASNSLIFATTLSTSVSKRLFLGLTVGASFRFVRKLRQDPSGNFIAGGDSTETDFLVGGALQYAAGDFFLILGGDNRRGGRVGLSRRFQF